MEINKKLNHNNKHNKEDLKMNMIRFHNHPAMNQVLTGIFNNPENSTSNTRANIYGNENSFVIELAAPGYSKEDFSINLEEQLLTISAEEKEHEIGDDKFLRREFTMEGISKSFRVPKTVDVENISAAYNNGILSVTLPVVNEAKIKKEIAIS